MVEWSPEALEHHVGERCDSMKRELEGRIDRLNEKIAECNTPWGTIGSLAVIIIMVITGYWALITTRFDSVERETRDVKADIVLLNKELVRRRAEFVEQVELRALEKRIDEKNRTQDDRASTFLTKFTFDAWKAERDKTIEGMQHSIDAMSRKSQ